jgi:hypothetical protein
MTSPIRIPKPSVPMTDPQTGLPTREYYLYNQQQDQQAAATANGLGAITLPNGSQSWAFQLFIPYPEDGIIRLIDSPYARTIAKVSARTATGTTTATTAGSGTLDGGPTAASTSQVSTAHTAGNAVAAGGDLTVTLSATSTDCTGLSVTISGTYTLA